MTSPQFPMSPTGCEDPLRALLAVFSRGGTRPSATIRSVGAEPEYKKKWLSHKNILTNIFNALYIRQEVEDSKRDSFGKKHSDRIDVDEFGDLSVSELEEEHER